ncbi:MAG: CoA transferase, partial [Actinomycetospora chiangmaiensis]|nr:CoA transferase [Actinomycetospora chiangmaiensis]
LDAMIGEWSAQHEAAELDRMLAEADVPSTIAYTAADIAADPQFRARGMVREVEDPAFGQVLHAGVVPRVTDDPGTIRWAGPAAGAHTDAILSSCGFDSEAVASLRAEGVVA